MNSRNLFLLLPAILLLACGQNKNEEENTANVTDTVSAAVAESKAEPDSSSETTGTDIYGQVWMTDNLNRVVFNNGDSIPEAKSAKDWLETGKAGKPAWCWYDFAKQGDSSKVRLYNYFAVMDARGLAPKGWHIPSQEEFEALITNYGGKKVAGKNMLASSQWGNTAETAYRMGASATRTGLRSFNGAYSNIEDFGYWWSNTSRVNGNAWHFVLNHKTSLAKTSFSQQMNGFAVRCIKDK
ncbi:MAG: fibrobacter succinogenes major paralogous domain-containing protein [Bacteroidia bacterium]|nr:fibrobacter succinogenes major paralogous domain-containing protein [Bacteroidia bacterium]